MCKICGGPNHHGCGCEAKQLREAKEAGLTENEAKTLQEPEPQPAEPIGPQPAEPSGPQPAEPILHSVNVVKILSSEYDIAKDIKTIADGIEGLCACMYDTNNYLKLIAGDCITIRKILTKEDEVKDAAENKN